MAHQFVVGTRGSALAVAQTRMVVDALHQLLADESEVSLEIAVLPTTGEQAIHSTAQADFSPGPSPYACAEQLRDALRERRIDVAVHYADQLPVRDGAGVRIACTPWRASTHDTLCTTAGWTLDTLPHGAVVGSASPCRTAQLTAYRDDLQVVPVRGTIERRLDVLSPDAAGAGNCDGVVVSEAGLHWLSSVNREVLDYVSQVIPYCIMLPSPGQGVLALEVRDPADDDDDPQYRALLEALERLNDPGTLLALTAERALVAALDANCLAPVAGFAWHQPSSAGTLLMRSEVFTPEGQRLDTLGDVRLPAPEWGGGSRHGWQVTTEMCDAAKSLGTALADDLFSQGYRAPQ